MVDDNSDQLNAQVVQALARASEPSLQDCKLIWHKSFPKEEELNEVFRNQLVTKCDIMTKEEFSSFKMQFSCVNDPMTK